MKRHAAIAKKCLCLIMLCLLTAGAFTVVSFADEREYHDVLYGTPVIDGVIDELYTYSYHAPIAANLINIQPWGRGGENTVFRTDAYVLWDESNLYFVGKVYDDTINYFSYDDSISDHEGYAEYADMFICCFLTEDTNQYFKIGADAFGMFLSAQDVTYNYIDVNQAQYACAVNKEGGYYIVEMALPFLEPLGEGFSLGWHFMVANAASKNTDGCYSCGPEGGCYSNSIRLISDSAAELVPPPPPPHVFSLSDIPDVFYAIGAGVLICAACAIIAFATHNKAKKEV